MEAGLLELTKLAFGRLEKLSDLEFGVGLSLVQICQEVEVVFARVAAL